MAALNPSAPGAQALLANPYAGVCYPAGHGVLSLPMTPSREAATANAMTWLTTFPTEGSEAWVVHNVEGRILDGFRCQDGTIIRIHQENDA